MRTLFLDTFSKGKELSSKRRPVWLMRQAGRYLPEYLDFRKKHSLLSCFQTPELAAEITHMPLRRFDLDAAILFSDLLVLLEVWKRKISYPESGGLCIEPPLESAAQLHVPDESELKEKLFYVFETISLLKPTLDIPLIGFCGAPFTLLCYLLEGKGGGEFKEVRTWIETRKEEFLKALDIICDTCILFARLQIQAGVQAFQIFDSWANLLSKEEFTLYVLPYWKKMQEKLSLLGVPLLFFSRANSMHPELISLIHPSGISFDEGKPLSELRKKVPGSIVIQGNFSPDVLLHGSALEVEEKALEMVRSLEGENGIIWNLGHGVLPKTPIANVEAFLKALR